jgi:uncharacterized protein YecE (DUF72 family)
MHWKGHFYPDELPAKDFLEFYIGQFKTVEINNSFCRLLKPGVFAAWCETVPADFQFSVKARR